MRKVTSKAYKILYVEDSPGNIKGVEKFLEGFPEFQLYEAASWEAAHDQLKAHKPDVILLDQGVDERPVQDLDLCIHFINSVRRDSPQTPIIVYSTIGYLRPAIVLATLRGRASYLVKEEVESGEMLTAYLKIALSGGVIYTQTATTYFDEMLVEKVQSLLTDYEKEIAQRIMRGLSNKEIAIQLGRNSNGVRDTIARLMRKIGVGSRSEIAVWYVRNYPNDQ